MKKEILIGFLVSLFATSCGLFLFIEYFSEKSIDETFQIIKNEGMLTNVIVLSAIPNLLIFFIYLHKNQEYRARGVILGTMLVAFITFALKFI